MKISIDRREWKYLAVLLIIPFILVNILLLPYYSGIHGTTHSHYGNPVIMNGTIDGDTTNDSIPYRGHFEGDLFVDSNTGWIFCNGKVRLWGELHIRDAVVDFEFSEDLDETDSHGLAPGTEYDYQTITLNGEKGEMEEGVPIWSLGFIGSAVGFALWLSWMIFKRTHKYGRQMTVACLLLGLFSLLNAWNATMLLFYLNPDSACVTCMICPMIFITGLVMAFVIKAQLGPPWPRWRFRIPRSLIVFGILVCLVSAFSVGYDRQYSGYGDQTYSSTSVINGIFFSLFGTFVGTIIIGFGLAKDEVGYYPIVKRRRIIYHHHWYDERYYQRDQSRQGYNMPKYGDRYRHDESDSNAGSHRDEQRRDRRRPFRGQDAEDGRELR